MQFMTGLYLENHKRCDDEAQEEVEEQWVDMQEDKVEMEEVKVEVEEVKVEAEEVKVGEVKEDEQEELKDDERKHASDLNKSHRNKTPCSTSRTPNFLRGNLNHWKAPKAQNPRRHTSSGGAMGQGKTRDPDHHHPSGVWPCFTQYLKKCLGYPVFDEAARNTVCITVIIYI